MYLLNIRHRVTGARAADAQRQQRLAHGTTALHHEQLQKHVKPAKTQQNNHLFISRCLRGAGDGCRRYGRHARNTLLLYEVVLR